MGDVRPERKWITLFTLHGELLRKTIFCIDSSPVDLLRVQSILDSRYTLVCMSDATLALREILTAPPDLILLGTETRGIGSVTFVKQMGESDPGLLDRLIVLAHEAQLVKAKTLTSEGACATVQKPLIPDELMFAVQAMFARLSSRTLSSLALHQYYMREHANSN